MEIVKQPDLQVFASEAKTGEIIKFPDVLRGWGVTLDQTNGFPPLEWMNDAFNRVDLNNLYLLQQGLPEWNSKIRYPVSALIKHQDKIYLCTAENENNEPSANSDKWSLYIRNASEKDLGVIKIATQAEVDAGTDDTKSVTPKKLKENLKKLPTASLTQKGITQLTSTLSDREDLSTTPKLVNEVNTKAVAAQTTANQAKTAAANAQISADEAFKDRGALGTIDLDTLGSQQHCGIYHQTGNANATSARHYPEAFAGSLLVMMAAGVTQIYIRYNSSNVWIRNNYQNKWSDWDRLAKSSEIIQLLQTTGTSTTAAMSQKAVTDIVIGIGQKWGNFTTQRVVGTTYRNTTSKPIFVSVTHGESASYNELYVDNVLVAKGWFVTGTGLYSSLQTIVPPGSTYYVKKTGEDNELDLWSELR